MKNNAAFSLLAAAVDIHTIPLVEAYEGIRSTQWLCHQLARKSGWWDEYDAMPEQYRIHFLGSKLALIHSEISESLEGLRKNTMDSHLTHRKAVEVELADSLIRTFDLAGAMGLDVAGAVIEKLAYNQQRADHKRENRAAEGGKKF